ncbi:metallophosphoesterase family protein [Macrococcus capreoli]|uniref:metallophosphoesterase family protein n=1 Tax=Macrococcus capreoli TaxID=2982690 RepID=UPI0021D5BF5D|nr:metallophosphoesterase family protein [Macrococcus sp. TMW 2.2395]MCU7558452.1 metallophosphoesterase family protein [Macrococcus sp. TMW 2.2395]
MMYKILQLTDLHFGALLPESNDIDNVTKALIKRLIDTHEPDFIAITGDVIWSLTPNSFTVFQDVLCFINNFNIPFGVTLGNHDSESDFARSKLYDVIRSLSHFTDMSASIMHGERMSYYVDMTVDDVQHRLYFIDTGDYDALKVGEYDYITHEQIDWLIAADKDFNGVGQLFIHIPIPEYEDAKALGLAEGHQDESICCPKLNTGLFSQLLLNDTSIKAIYCGHDHDNDFQALYHGIQLNYGRVTGFNTYGHLRRGGRLITIEGNHINSVVVE